MSAIFAHAITNRMNMQPALVCPNFATELSMAIRELATADDDGHEARINAIKANTLLAYGYVTESNDKIFAYANGIAFIPVTGMLINRFNSCYGYVTGYNFIRSWYMAALEDADVNAIVLDCHSGGGEVAGCFELSRDIAATRDRKPVLAVVDSASYSACYALASAATKIIAAPSAGVGSIGVVAMHMNVAKMLEEYGIEITFIYSGDHKVDGNPYESLPEPVRKSIQSRVDSTRMEFVDLVASNRGLDAKMVFDTQAQCYSAKDAETLRLIDGVATPGEAVKAFTNGLSTFSKKDITMKVTGTEEAQGANTVSTPVANTNEAVKTVDTVATRDAERQRISGILTHSAAANRGRLANHLALKTQLSVDEAVATLEASPEEKATAEPSTSAFERAMSSSEHPQVGAEATGSDGEVSPAQRILRNQATAVGAA